MNKAILGLAFFAVAVISVAASWSASATTVNHNVGSIIKVSDSCADMADIASHNVGSIVKIDGGGQCDIKEILKSPAVTNNVGSIIKITNVCGDTSRLADRNVGSIVKIESNGACKKDQPTTVVVTEEDTDNEANDSHEETAMPTSLPKTGPGLETAGLALAVGGVTYLAAYVVNRSRSL